MKKLAAVTLFALLLVSCRGVVPQATPLSSSDVTVQSGATVMDVSGSTCSRRGADPYVIPRTLTLTMTSAGSHGRVTVCAKHMFAYKVTASPAGIVSVPTTVRPTGTGTHGMGKTVIPVRALHRGQATIALADSVGHTITLRATVAFGRLYVAERLSTGYVKVFNTLNFAQTPASIGPLSGAEGVAVAMDPASGLLYATADFTNDVKVFDTAGGCPYQLVTTISGFHTPSGIAVDSAAQTLYVTELGDVKVYSTANGHYTYMTTLGAAAGIDIPGGLAVDPDAQKLYVAQGSGDVKVFNTADLSQPPVTISGISQPGGVAIDHAAGKVYVTENYAGDVRVYDETTNQYLDTIATGLSQPYGDADDSAAGKLYVIEFTKDDVKVFNTLDPSQPPGTISGVLDPWAVAVGP